MNKIDSRSKTVRELLDGVKYSIEFYQHEYKWGTKQIAELLEDLEEKFLQNYEEEHERKKVREYSHYLYPLGRRYRRRLPRSTSAKALAVVDGHVALLHREQPGKRP